MDNLTRREIFEHVQRACDEVTKGYHEQTGNRRIKFRVLQLVNKENSKLENDTDIVRKSATLYDEYEGNEEYIHIPSMEQMLENLQKHIVIGIEDTETGELEGVTTIKYYENNGDNVNPYYPRKDTKYFEVTGVIVKQRENMANKGLGTSMYEACFLGLHQYAKAHPDAGYKMDVVIDCTNIKSLYAAQNAVNNIAARNLVGEGKKIDLNLAGIYIVKNPETKTLVEAPTFVLESDLNEKAMQAKANSEEVTFAYKKPNAKREKAKEYRGLKRSILRKMKRVKDSKRNAEKRQIGLRIANDILENVQNEDMKIVRNLDEDAGYVDFIDLSQIQVEIESMKLKTNGAENIGAKRKRRNDVDKFIGPMPSVRANIEEER